MLKWAGLGLLALFIGSWWLPGNVVAQDVGLTFFSDTLSTSAPLADANHTFNFTLGTDVAPGGSLTFTWPSDFVVRPVSSTFNIRNVEMLVDGTPRTATSSPSATADGVAISSGAGGSITYTLNSTEGLNDGEEITFRVGNQTANSLDERTVVLGTSSTTTLPADTPPVQNATNTGTHLIEMTSTGAADALRGEFIVYLLEQVGAGPLDTTEEIPPLRFGGAPTGTISGTTQNVEISLETDEFADCRYSTSASTTYSAMPASFNSSGLIVHRRIVSVTPETDYTFFVRCTDDEGNINVDDYLIEFSVPPEPTGSSNPDAEPGGDGSGENTTGAGGGGGTGTGTGGASSGSGSQSSGSGGGGSGGGGGGGSSVGTGGGFENTGPYESGEGRVYVTGTAWPRADVYVMVDGQIAEDTRADSDGKYTVLLDEIARGAYTFGIYGEDDNGVRSNTFSTSFTVSGARAITLSNIDIIGTIDVTPDPVDPGEPATIRGFTVPDAMVTIENRRQGGAATSLQATSNGNGLFTTDLDTNGFSTDTYEIRFQATPSEGETTEFTDWFFYGVGQQADEPINADLNRDGNVNLTDFSILLFWWDGDGGDSDPPADINQDGRVSLTDFSILLFNWTG